METDPYKKLGVNPDAGDKEIRRAYLRRVKQDHPDTGHDGGDAFRRLNDAYEAIRTPERRRHLASRRETERQERYRKPEHHRAPGARPGAHRAWREYDTPDLFETFFMGANPFRLSRRYRAEVRLPRVSGGKPFVVDIEFPDRTRTVEVPADAHDGEILTFHEMDPFGRTVHLDLRVWIKR
jgi:curved DNA-binding protein CbpA